MHRWWRALREEPRDDDSTAVLLEPLAFWPERRSAILGDKDDGGDVGVTLGAIAGYAFHTNYVPSTGGRIIFRIALKQLSGTRGQLIVNINGLDYRGDPLPPMLERYSLAQLLAAGGEIELSAVAVYGDSFAVMGTLIEDSDARAETIEISVIGADNDDSHLARLEAAQRGFLAAPGEDVLADIIVDRPPTLRDPISQMCTAAQMVEKSYAKMCKWMQERPQRHRKQWEFAFIMRALEHHGALKPGARGLGFGVGIEPLTSVFANLGCTIVATDLPAEDQRALVWNDTDQLGANLDQIHRRRLCDKKRFYERVTYRPVDMNAIPEDLTDFDFTWSSCAYEHLGSIENGLAFFENSLKCLKPGGLAVHTTELNLSSNDSTLASGSTVIFRRRDFEELARRLIARGHDVFPISFDSGDADLDRVIDIPPYANDPHLKLALLRWVSTSFGMIVRKGH